MAHWSATIPVSARRQVAIHLARGPFGGVHHHQPLLLNLDYDLLIMLGIAMFIKGQPLHGQLEVKPGQGLADGLPGGLGSCLENVSDGSQQGPGGSVAVHGRGVGLFADPQFSPSLNDRTNIPGTNRNYAVHW